MFKKKMFLVTCLISCGKPTLFIKKKSLEREEISLAITNNEKEILENKLENKDLYVKNERGEYPIHEAVVKGKKEIFKYLLERSSSVKYEEKGKTLDIYEYVAKYGNIEIFNLLDKNKYMYYIAKKAYEGNKQEILEEIYKKLEAKKIHKIITEEKLEDFKKGLETKEIDIEATDKNGYNALMIAAINGHKEMCEILIEKELDVNYANKDGITALVCAAESGSKESIEILIKAGADVNSTITGWQNKGKTALMYAAGSGNKESIEILLDRGVDVNYANKDGITALMYAAGSGNKESIEKLIKAGADVNVKNYKGKTALMYAAGSGNKESIEILIKAGADVNFAITEGYDKGKTALMYAAGSGDKESIEKLIKAGADVNVKNKDGCTALMYAAGSGNKESIEILIKAGADVNSTITRWQNKGKTALMFAAGSGDKESIEILLDRGADINFTITGWQNKGKTALMFAAGSGNKESIEILLEAGADVNAQDKDGWSALMIAAGSGNKESIEILLDRGANVNFPMTGSKNKGKTALMYAVESGSKEIIEILLDRGANVNFPMTGSKNKGKTALMYAAGSGNKESIEILLEAGADVNAKNYEGQTALMCAAESGSKESIKILLDRGANVNAKSKYERKTALMCAAESGSKESIKILLEAGADVNFAITEGYDKGKTALMYAAESGNKESIEILLEAGADVNFAMTGLYEGKTALMYAAGSGNKECIEILLDRGADVNYANKYGATVLMYAAESVSKESIEILLEAGADVNAKNYEGQTALMYAVESGSKENIEILLEAGADVNFAITEGYDKGKTALMYAAESGNKESIEILLEAGADVNAKNYEGQTALMYAAGSGKKENIEILLDRGADINYANKDGITALMYAAGSENKESIEILLDKGANINVKSKYEGQTALMYAAKSGSKESIEILLDKGANINVKSKYEGQTALMYAAKSGSKESIEILVKVGANVNAKNYEGQTALMYIAESGDKESIEILIKAGVDVNVKNNNERTALMCAAQLGKKENIEILIKAGADVNVKNNEGKTALMNAVNKESIEILIKAGAEVNAIDLNGWTALIFAVESGDKECIEILIKAGADIALKNNEGKSATYIAYKNRNIETLKILISYGASTIYSFGVFGNKNLLKGKWCSNELRQYISKEMLLYLSKAGEYKKLSELYVNYKDLIDLSSTDDQDKNIFHYLAIGCNDFNILYKFFGKAVNLDKTEIVNALDSEGYSPLHYAVLNNNDAMLAVLIEFKFNLSHLTSDGRDVFDLCREEGNKEILTKLSLFIREDSKPFSDNVGKISRMTKEELEKLDLDNEDKKDKKNKSDGMNVLHRVIVTEKVTKRDKIVTYLIEREVNCNIKDIRGIDALNYAIMFDEQKCFELIVNKIIEKDELKEGSEEYIKYIEKVLEDALGYGSIECMKILMEKGATLKDNAVIRAIKGEKREILKLVLEKRPELAIKKDEGGNLPIHIVCSSKVKDMIYELVEIEEVRKKIDEKNNEGYTALHEAHSNFKINEVIELIKAGANPSIKDKEGRRGIDIAIETPPNEEDKHLRLGTICVGLAAIQGEKNLEQYYHNPEETIHFATKEGKIDVVREMINLGTKDKRDREKKTALHYAAMLGNKKILQILLQNGAKIDIKDKEGNIALHYAKDYEITKLLIEAGSNVNKGNKTKNISLHSFLQRAEKEEENEVIRVVKIYINNGVKKDTTNAKKEKAYMIAEKKGMNEVVKTLKEDERKKDKKCGAIDKKETFVSRISNSTEEKIERIISGIGNPNEEIEEGKNIIHILIEREEKEKLEGLFRNKGIIDKCASIGALIREIDNRGYNCYRYAIEKKRCDLFEMLIDRDENILKEDKNGDNVLNIALRQKEVKYVEIIINKLKEEDIDKIYEMTNNPIKQAIIGDRIEELRKILRYIGKQNVGRISIKVEEEIADLIIEEDKEEIIKIYIEEGIDVDKQNKEGKALMHKSIDKNSIKVFNELVKKGDVLKEDKEGITPLHLSLVKASGEYFKKIIKEITKNNREEEMKDLKINPIIMGIMMDKDEEVKELIRISEVGYINKVIEIKKEDELGNAEEITILEAALINGKDKIAEAVIKKGMEEEVGRKGIIIAAQLGKEKLVEMMLREQVKKDKSKEILKDKIKEVFNQLIKVGIKEGIKKGVSALTTVMIGIPIPEVMESIKVLIEKAKEKIEDEKVEEKVKIPKEWIFKLKIKKEEREAIREIERIERKGRWLIGMDPVENMEEYIEMVEILREDTYEKYKDKRQWQLIINRKKDEMLENIGEKIIDRMIRKKGKIEIDEKILRPIYEKLKIYNKKHEEYERIVKEELKEYKDNKKSYEEVKREEVERVYNELMDKRDILEEQVNRYIEGKIEKDIVMEIYV